MICVLAALGGCGRAERGVVPERAPVYEQAQAPKDRAPNDRAATANATGRIPAASERPSEVLTAADHEPDAKARAAAKAAGVKLVSPEQARRVALHFASLRWKGSTLGPARLAFAPDGVPEVYFYVICKNGAPDVSSFDGELSALRECKAALELDAAALNDEKPGIAESLRTVNSLMRASDRYATIVVGANDGREPFIASFGGLPPHIVLRDDALAARRAQLAGKQPAEPRMIWLPPMFVLFEFSSADGNPPAAYEARGAELGEVSLTSWQRPSVDKQVMEQRVAKWRCLTETPGE